MTIQKLSWVALLVLASCTGGAEREPGEHSEEEAHGARSHEPAAHPESHEDEMPETVRLSSAAMAEAGIATWTVRAVDLAHLLWLTGEVAYDENRLVHLGTNVSGRVVRIPVDLGERVAAGQPVAELESAELARAREELGKNLAALWAAERSYERARELVAAQAISQGEFQTREAEVLAARAAVESAERTLLVYGEDPAEIAALRQAVAPGESVSPPVTPARLLLRAPFAGRVMDRKVPPGSLVEAMEPILTLADLTRVWVFLRAYEKDLGFLREGLPVLLRVDAYPRETFRGEIDFLGGVVDPETRTVRLRAVVPNPEEKLRPGMFVRGEVEVPQPHRESRPVLVVPPAALQTLEGRTVVFVQVEPGLFASRAVEIGHTFEGFTEILAGVRAGEEVVTEGSFVLKAEFARATLTHEH